MPATGTVGGDPLLDPLIDEMKPPSIWRQSRKGS
jgi:hypothetical protein